MRDRNQEQGYNLVILMVAVTLLSIMLAAVLPVWSTAAQRDREEELIFRGLQYAEAIRLFQQRFGRLPVRLEELIEVEPRCIRRLWEDPITGKRDWRLVRGQVPPGMQPGGVARPGDDPDGRPGDPDAGEEVDEQNLPDGGAGLGPIRGVRSRSGDEALKRFFDKDRYSQWLFTVDLLNAAPNPAQGVGPQGAATGLRLNARWLGRPFQHGLRPAGEMAPGPAGSGLGPAPPLNAPEEPPPPVDKG